jgi:hypothetical protein
VLQHLSLQPAVADHAVRLKGVEYNLQGLSGGLRGVVGMGEDFEGGEKVYRVRARNARIRAMRRTLLIATCKNKAAQQRTIAIII